uniref:NADH dehydrogenase subunit 6 n=1 Tax=Polypylis sp. TS-2018 TaxID=2483258 RepID=UPI002A7F213D|nr:NADH dehydrogenase subunit 6 [Polypylis sp. TS-2018]WOZ13952.1 NADH dehydrogenase subunit 6 [Polypylis sp. TS-2018]
MYYLTIIISSIMLMLSYPVYSSPVFYSLMMFFASVYIIFFMSVFLSGWYSYLLFLVYIGGLLVLFMYVCFMSSNDKLSKYLPNLFLIILNIWFFLFEPVSEVSSLFMGFSMYESSFLMSMSMFMLLVVILLFSLFIIIRIVNLKKSLIV